ncbi:MAG: hypothetical protein V4591_04975 [Bdellovibrionota bacterium]
MPSIIFSQRIIKKCQNFDNDLLKISLLGTTKIRCGEFIFSINDNGVVTFDEGPALSSMFAGTELGSFLEGTRYQVPEKKALSANLADIYNKSQVNVIYDELHRLILTKLTVKMQPFSILQVVSEFITGSNFMEKSEEKKEEFRNYLSDICSSAIGKIFEADLKKDSQTSTVNISIEDRIPIIKIYEIFGTCGMQASADNIKLKIESMKPITQSDEIAQAQQYFRTKDSYH